MFSVAAAAGNGAERKAVGFSKRERLFQHHDPLDIMSKGSEN